MSANQLRGEIAIDLGGGIVAVLRPTYEALVAIEDETGRGLFDLANRMVRKTATISEMVAVVRGGMKAGGGLPPDDLGRRLLNRGVVKVMIDISAFLAGAITGGQEGNGRGAAA